MFLSGHKLTYEQQVMAAIFDKLRFIAWTHTEDARKGRRYKGKSLLEELSVSKEDSDELESFASVEEYDAYMKRFETGG